MLVYKNNIKRGNKMNLDLLKQILASKIDSSMPIVSWSNNEAHLTNTWISYCRLKEDKFILLPAAGMSHLEKDLTVNKELILSFTNREILGNLDDGNGGKLPGTGVVCRGTGELLCKGEDFDYMKTQFPWMRACLKVCLSEAKQTL